MLLVGGNNLDEKLKLVKPNVILKNEYLNMLSEWKVYGGEIIPWSLNLDTTDFISLVDKLNAYSDGINLQDAFVPSTTLLVDK